MRSSPGDRRRGPPASSPITAVDPVPSHREWLPRLVRIFRPRAAANAVQDAEVNPLLAFPSETVTRPDAAIAEVAKRPVVRQPEGERRGTRRWLFAAAAIVVVSGLTLLAIRYYPALRTGSTAPLTGKLTLDTRPVGAEVLVNGERRGVTPLTFALPVGSHRITIRNGSDERNVPIAMTAGAEISQYFELKPAETAAALGRLSVVTDPAGAPVTVDGRPRGVSPVTIADLTAGEHTVTVAGLAGAVERTVVVAAGATASAMFSLPKSSGPMGGWLSMATPFEIEVVEQGEVIGTSAMTRIMLSAGRHDLVLSNRSVGFSEARRIDVTPGKTIALHVDAPKVPVSINARPWAEIMVDGESVGQTPIANLSVAIGSHEVIFRHPQLPEKRQTVIVTTKGPNRIAMDLSR
jgi:hypothetical protein